MTTKITHDEVHKIQETARTIRHHIVNMISCKPGKVGHLGGSCSAADLVAALYFHKMNLDPANLNDPDRDYFLLSKGHAALVQYAALAELGVITNEELLLVKTCGAKLQGHPDKTKTPGVEANTGSLGQGVSLALGIALGQRMDKRSSKVYVLMGDGEQAEGQIWEAAMAAAAYKMTNLIAILDNNGVQAMGTLKERLDSGDLSGKWRAFGWNVIEIDGHNIESICDAYDIAELEKERPTVIVAHTIKGKGISFAEGKAAFHNAGLTPEQFQEAHRLIDSYKA